MTEDSTLERGIVVILDPKTDKCVRLGKAWIKTKSGIEPRYWVMRGQEHLEEDTIVHSIVALIEDGWKVA